MLWGFYPGNVFFAAELLLGELIFLYPVPKRKVFPARLIAALTIVMVLAGFIPRITDDQLRIVSDLMRFVGIFVGSVVMFGTCFRIKTSMLVSMCVAGYAVQHLAYNTAWLLRQLPTVAGSAFAQCCSGRLYEVVLILTMYVIATLTIGRFSARHECYRNSDMRFNYLSLTIMFICVGLTRFSRLFGDGSMTATDKLYSIVCCMLALYVQFMLHKLFIIEHENRTMELMRQEERKQYEISRNATESLNIKLHDLRHMLAERHIDLTQEEAESLRRDISNYDSSINTGHETLNVLLTEKKLRCQRLGVRLSCSGDYSALSFMKKMDVYSIFGNAVDNAIEAVSKLDQSEKKLIDVSIEERGDVFFIGVTNYFDGVLLMEDGIPQTSKADEPGYHGYGIKSMRLIAAKYAGEVAISANEELFSLNIYLKRPNND